MWSLRRIAPALPLVLGLIASSAGAPPGQQGTAIAPTTVREESNADWSLDDVKDVFEALQFVAITIGIGVAVYWLFREHLPQRRAVSIEFGVDVLCVGETESAWLIEVIAIVHNLGTARTELFDGQFSLSAVESGSGTGYVGPLLQPPALTPLFDGTWSTSEVLVDAGARTRVLCAATVPRTVTHVVVTGQITNPGRVSAYTASRLVELKGPRSA
jgi:hypothetical protein